MPNVYRRRPGLLRLLARRVGARFHWRALWLRGVRVKPWLFGLPPRMLRIQHSNCRCWPSPMLDNFGVYRYGVLVQSDDRAAIEGDWRAVGEDMWAAIKQYEAEYFGKSVYVEGEDDPPTDADLEVPPQGRT